ncbi:hypothetical protein RDWZM_009165 [Blomia tropicalis]|uniref:Uncharacterized protein n=1 Tax=Blomia tropicalis TaxID=40697 RepID=A0A9Q0M3F3_BLOTA|nr:hypothetical protein RDWZM_009165 [Blomia tropicalis]
MNLFEISTHESHPQIFLSFALITTIVVTSAGKEMPTHNVTRSPIDVVTEIIHNNSSNTFNLVNHASYPSTNSSNLTALAHLIQALPFLPILIVLVLMFACLCMVLRLFSKARFRDNRSSIFVNPKTLKVAQAQERRLSQLSQLSGSGLRTPRTPCRSPIHSVRSSRSSYGSNIYPIHDPVVMHGPNPVLMKEKSRSNSISSSKLLP